MKNKLKGVLYLPLKRLDIVILIPLQHKEMKKQLEMQFKICWKGMLLNVKSSSLQPNCILQIIVQKMLPKQQDSHFHYFSLITLIFTLFTNQLQLSVMRKGCHWHILMEQLFIIPKSTCESHIKENSNLNFTISEENMNKLRSRERCYRLIDSNKWWNKDYYITEFRE